MAVAVGGVECADYNGLYGADAVEAGVHRLVVYRKMAGLYQFEDYHHRFVFWYNPTDGACQAYFWQRSDATALGQKR